jgi:NADH-quinone oxidoreductase subunit F
MAEGYQLKGFLPGGASTDFLTPDHLDIPMEYESIMQAGSRMGTGTMIILDDRSCAVGMIANLAKFFARESCGFCTPCREGLPWVQEVLDRIEAGNGEPDDIEVLQRQSQFIGAIGNTHCAHAPGAMEPLASGLKYFQDEFITHIEGKACPYQREV